MSLRKKTLLLFASSLTGSFLLSLLAIFLLVVPGFHAAERERIADDATRGVALIDRGRRRLDDRARSWAEEAATLGFLKTRDPAKLDPALVRRRMLDLDLDLFAVVDDRRDIAHLTCLDPESRAEVFAAQGVFEMLAREDLGAPRAPGEGLSGLVRLDGDLLLLAARPIAGGADGVRGTLLLGRRLGPRRVAALAETVGLPLSILPPDAPGEAAGTGVAGVTVESAGPDRLRARAVLRDLGGRRAGILRLESPRPLDRRGASTAWALALAALLGAGIAAAAGVFALRKLVLGRWELLDGVVDGIEELADLSVRIGISGDDEAARIARSVNSLLDAHERQVRKHEDAERRVVEARRGADAAAHAKSMFLANMSHEIRTPMNGVIGMTELALMTDVTGEQREYLQAVMTSAQALLALLTDLLDVSKIESGKLELESVSFDLRSVFEDAAHLLTPQVASKDLDLVCSLDPELPVRVTGDANRLRQVLVNLLGNAVKFTHEGEVAIRCEVEERGDDWIVIHGSVKDTGPGIPRNQLSHIFENFGQADESTTRRFGGTGLGLSIAKHLVERMSGRLWVISRPGEGSTFHFTARFETVCGSGSPWNLNSDQRPVRVLIVDDSPSNRIILSRTLDHWGISHDEASTGRQALDVLRLAHDFGRAFDVVLLDESLPGLDGAGVVAEIRGDRRLEGTHVIMLSAVGRPPSERERHVPGVSCYLVKPLRQQQLHDAIQECVSLAAVEAPPAGPGDEVLPDIPRTGRMPPLRILLAEDNAVNEMLAVRLLERSGHEVTVARDGEQALALWAPHRFDVVLMDVQMPRLDGWEATRRIRVREGEGGRRVPIIAMTAHALGGDRERCLAAGMDDYVAKPFRLADVEVALIRVLGFGDRKPRGARTSTARESERCAKP